MVPSPPAAKRQHSSFAALLQQASLRGLHTQYIEYQKIWFVIRPIGDNYGFLSMKISGNRIADASYLADGFTAYLLYIPAD